MHQARLFHGCLRPANVLLEEGFAPVVTDAGTLKLEDYFPGTAATKHEYAAYAAQEVRQGQKPDGRSDIFSLGRLLHFLLMGEEPDEPDDDLPLLEQLKDAPAGLVRIIRRCTLRDPSGRYGSVEELLDDFGRHGHAERVGLPHPDGLEGKREESPAASSAVSKPAKRKKPIEPVASIRRPHRPAADATPEDPFEGGRAVVVAGSGLLIFAAGLTLAYLRGFPNNVAEMLSYLGAVGMSVAVPSMRRRPWLSRLLFVVLSVVAVMALEPVSGAAKRGCRAKLESGDAAERGTKLLSLRARGRVNFVDLDLQNIDLHGLRLRGISFAGSNLSKANFRSADLTGAVVAEAELSGVDLRGATLTYVNVATTKGWRHAVCDEESRMPEGWLCVSDRPRSAAEHDGL